MFFAVNDGKIQQYDASNGTLISDFGGRKIYTRKEAHSGQDGDQVQYVIHLADKRNYLFTVIDEKKDSECSIDFVQS